MADTTPESCCDDTGPTAFVQLRICPETRCQGDGVAGMVKLILAGDRASDEEIIDARTACRACDERATRANRSNRPICARDGQALHWRTAVGSYTCDKWPLRRGVEPRSTAGHR